MGCALFTGTFRLALVLCSLMVWGLGLPSSQASAASSGASAWGDNSSGQLGDGHEGFTTGRTAPIAVNGLTGVRTIASRGRDSLALLEDGTVDAWGDNNSGQLGDGTTTNSDVPVAVSGLSGVTAVASGGDHNLALLSDGNVMSWGWNASGPNDNVPVEVKGLSGVIAIAANNGYNLALLENGAVMEWPAGENNAPVEVQGLDEVTAIAAGSDSRLALLKNGSVMAWGSNEWGALGNGSEVEGEYSRVPVPVCAVDEKAPCKHDLTGVTSVSADWFDSLALLSDGTVVAWGWNGEGELGDGSEGLWKDAPVAVSDLSEVTAIANGNYHSLALLKTGTVEAWGNDEYGQLGDGRSGLEARSDVPVAVSGLGGVTAIAASEWDSLAITERAAPIPTITKVQPDQGPVGGGTSVTITGANLTGVTEVTFGSTNATSFKIESETEITAVSPPGTAGTINVGVASHGGLSAISSADQFSYAAPLIESESESNITDHRVTLEAQINPDGFETEYELWLECGIELQCGSAERVGFGRLPADDQSQDVSVALSDLTSGDSYRYWVVATDSDGLTKGAVRSFAATSSGSMPVSDTGGVSNLSQTGATLEGRIYPEGEGEQQFAYFFEYGASAAYGSSAPKSPGGTVGGGASCGLICESEKTDPKSVSVNLTGLEPGATYHYRLVSTDAEGYRSYGNDAVFTTDGEKLSPSTRVSETLSSVGNEQPGVLGVTPLNSPPAKTVKPESTPRTQKLAKALKACEKRARRQRATCRKQAERKYAVTAGNVDSKTGKLYQRRRR
jgi:alpha-tubulin suppressor-like RCC1 family protein